MVFIFMSEAVFEQCQSHFTWGTYEDKIPKDDIVRLIKKVVKESKDKWDHLIPVKKMGRKRHSRVNMISLLIFSYMDNTRDATEIYKRIQYDDRYKYICDGIIPSYTSIKDYRNKIEDVVLEILKEILDIALKEEYTKYEHVICDGSTFKSFNSPENVIHEEDVNTLSKIYKTGYMSKESVDSLRKNGKDFLQNNLSLNEKLKLLNIYNKELENSNYKVTPMFDTDAKFMKNKKGYTMLGHNVQFVTDAKTKLILAIHVSNEGSDAYQLPPAIDKALENINTKPEKVSADNAYRNEISSQYTKKQGMIGYFPSKKQAKENKGNLSKNKYHKDNMTYDYDKDLFICYNNQELPLQKTRLKANSKREKLGLPLETERTYYNKEACASCKYAKDCFSNKAKYRTIVDTGSEDLLEIQKRMDTPEGKKEYKNRSSGESPIGIFKQQKGIYEIPVTGCKNIEKRLYLDVVSYGFKILKNLGYNKY